MSSSHTYLDVCLYLNSFGKIETSVSRNQVVHIGTWFQQNNNNNNKNDRDVDFFISTIGTRSNFSSSRSGGVFC